MNDLQTLGGLDSMAFFINEDNQNTESLINSRKRMS
jgi:hypothetical protein